MTDPLCTATHPIGYLDPACRCNEYAKVRQHERQRLASTTTTEGMTDANNHDVLSLLRQSA
jgi:hypothetical protein